MNMSIPGEMNSFNKKKGSYTPGDENLDNTPYKPVPLMFQQAEGTLPADSIDRNGNMHGPSSHRPESPEKRRKRMIIAVAIVLLLVLLLAIIISLSICLATDYCSSSASSSNARKFEPAYRARLKASFASPIIPEPGNAPFNEHLITTLASLNSTAFNSSADTNGTIAGLNATVVNRRRKRETDVHFSVNTTDLSEIERFLMGKIAKPLFESIKSTIWCQEIDCRDMRFENFQLSDNDELVTTFDWAVGSNRTLVISPELIENVTTRMTRNFSGTFSQMFPGYRLGDMDLAFDLLDFCNYTSIVCQDFTGIDDSVPTESASSSTSTPTTTTTSVETDNMTDRSVLLPNIIQLFSLNDSDIDTTMSTLSTTIEHDRITTTERTPVHSTNAPVVGLVDCSMYGFVCTDRKHKVSSRQRCDGIVDCPDGSDEKSCHQCRTSFSCPDKDGHWLCQSGKLFCDGRSICPTDVDDSALHCKASCASSEYNCRNSNICISKKWLCDGDAQCPQEDDESNCSVPSTCNNNAFFCAADSRCIASWMKCNGVRDCSDGADEANCSCVDCSGDNVALCSAPFGNCIQRKAVCDGKPDCPNGEDEMNCRR